MSLEPFWLSATMHNEPVMFVGRPAGAIEAQLLFKPDAEVTVNSVAGDISYSEGEDYRLDQPTGRIIRLPASRIPCATPESAAAADGELTLNRTVTVSYTHRRDPWQGFIPSYAGNQLPRLMHKLKQRDAVTICLTGDSISEGYDASGFHGLAPHQPAFGTLVATGLEQRSHAVVHFHNSGTGGWTTADALWDIERITSVKPDVVIVAFGMNDASFAEADEYAGNVSNLLASVKNAVRDAEFLLVSPMLPTPECDWLVHSRFLEYRDALATLSADGVALADVTSMWTDLVARKDPHHLSGNGWNHPNDFGHRVYAQTILATLGFTSSGGPDGLHDTRA